MSESSTDIKTCCKPSIYCSQFIACRYSARFGLILMSRVFFDPREQDLRLPGHQALLQWQLPRLKQSLEDSNHSAAPPSVTHCHTQKDHRKDQRKPDDSDLLRLCWVTKCTSWLEIWQNLAVTERVEAVGCSKRHFQGLPAIRDGRYPWHYDTLACLCASA